MQAVNKLWFQNQLQSSQITQRKMAKVLRLDPSAVSLILQGKRGIKLSEATELARLFGVPLEDVLVAAGIRMQVETKQTLELSGTITAESVVMWGTPRGQSTVPKPLWTGKDVRALRYQTPSSQLEGVDGALVYFRHCYTGIDPEALGKLAVVEGAGVTRLGVLRRGYGVGRFTLLTLDGRVQVEDFEAVAAHPVVWMKL